MTPEDKTQGAARGAGDPLAAFFAATEAPAADPFFRSEVMEAVARRRLRIDLVIRFGAGLLIAVALWASAPALSAELAVLARSLDPAAAALAATAAAAAGGWAFLSGALRLPRLPRRLF